MMNLDDQLLEHPKFVRAVRLAGSAAIHMWLGLRAFCAQKLTDGYIEPDMVDEPRGPKGRERTNALAALQAVGLVHGPNERLECVACRSAPFVDDGIWMHDYLQWSESRDEALIRRVSNRDRQRQFRNKNRVSNGVTNAGEPTLLTPPHTNPDPDPNQTRPKESAGARDPARSVDPLMNPDETVMPSGLRERALEPGNAVDHLAKTLKVPRAVIVAELEDFCRYREAGAGMGDKRRMWLAHFRQQVINRHKRGELKAIGLVEHEANDEARPPRKVKTTAEMEQEALDARS